MSWLTPLTSSNRRIIEFGFRITTASGTWPSRRCAAMRTASAVHEGRLANIDLDSIVLVENTLDGDPELVRGRDVDVACSAAPA